MGGSIVGGVPNAPKRNPTSNNRVESNPKMLPMSFVDVPSGACQGDSGGPLAVQVAGTYEVWGATSYGTLECNTTTGTSGVWAKVWGVRDWIISVTGGECPRG